MRTVLLCLVLTGCASQLDWWSGDKTFGETSRDKSDCAMQSEMATASIRGMVERVYEKGRLNDMCMQSRGYIQYRK